MILSSMTVEGQHGLYMAWKRGVPATDFLPSVLQKEWVLVPARLFTFFAIATSFVGVSLSLSDFLADGLRIKRKRWEGRLLTVLLTFLPPVIFVYFFPRGFILALEYAGAFVAILLGLLPAMMAWKLKTPAFYQTIRGKCLLLIVMILSLFIVYVDIALQRGYLQSFLKKYV
jgi:tyrosine-specific transport protein